MRLCAVALSPSFASRSHLFQWDPLAARVGCASGRLICVCQRSKLFDFSPESPNHHPMPGHILAAGFPMTEPKAYPGILESWSHLVTHHPPTHSTHIAPQYRPRLSEKLRLVPYHTSKGCFVCFQPGYLRPYTRQYSPPPRGPPSADTLTRLLLRVRSSVPASGTM